MLLESVQPAVKQIGSGVQKKYSKQTWKKAVKMPTLD